MPPAFQLSLSSSNCEDSVGEHVEVQARLGRVLRDVVDDAAGGADALGRGRTIDHFDAPDDSMSVNTLLRLPSRNGVLCGMPSNKRSGTRPRSVSPRLLTACERFGIARTVRASTAVASCVRLNVRDNFLLRDDVDGAGNLVDGFRRACAGDDDFFDPRSGERVWSCACAAACAASTPMRACETTQRCTQCSCS